jgi:hydrogenase maturation factor
VPLKPEQTRVVAGRPAARAPAPAACMPMRVLALKRAAGGALARCAGIDGIPATVETALVGPLEPGAVVLVQRGVALLRLDEEWQW